MNFHAAPAAPVLPPTSPSAWPRPPTEAPATGRNSPGIRGKTSGKPLEKQGKAWKTLENPWKNWEKPQKTWNILQKHWFFMVFHCTKSGFNHSLTRHDFRDKPKIPFKTWVRFRARCSGFSYKKTYRMVHPNDVSWFINININLKKIHEY